MVTRKPVPNRSPNSNTPPYPTSPASSSSSGLPATLRVGDAPNTTGSEPDSTAVWGLERVPIPPQEHAHVDPSNLPETLKPGPAGIIPKPSNEPLKPQLTSTNPFLRRKVSQGASSSGKESSAEVWGDDAEKLQSPAHAPPPVPQVTDQFSNMAVSDQTKNPWQPNSNQDRPLQTANFQRQDSGNEAWSNSHAGAAVATPPELADPSQQPVLVEYDEPESPAWDEEEDEPDSPVKATPPVLGNQHITEDQNAWGGVPAPGLQHVEPLPVQNSGGNNSNGQAESWNLIDHDPLPESAQQSGIVGLDGTEVSRFPTEENPPALPPRRSQEHPPPQPPRPTVDTSNRSTSSIAASGTPSTTRRQRGETYEVKKISWYDKNAESNPRISPILVQNANGPCPLLALVNALTLSTPANVETGLVETLRSREQVSLGLLLDAVFEELMSGRRGDAAHELPDVGDLYAFLLTLHTGMNVNPLFFPAPATKSPIDPRNSMTHIHPSEREAATPGTFEETREMKLYSTFSIPLIHGWLPEPESPAYLALKRSAGSYEDAQNLMFREEELEDKLVREGLSFQEQGTLEDISTIKAFLNTAATQLTPHGLETVTGSVVPGSVAILFRNDHFSTLYRHPNTHQLFQLISDSGYAGREDVVWESLIDVNGERAEFFSGDFRVVSGSADTQEASGADGLDTSGRNIVHEATQNQASSNELTEHYQPESTLSAAEQEDRDFALALQLQEEEDERNRSEAARRRRETELSQQYIEQQAGNNNVPVNQRGGNTTENARTGVRRPSTRVAPGARDARPVIPPRRNNITNRPVDPEAGVDAPPPSYEQAATEAPYIPSEGHPSHPNASPNRPPQRRTSAYSANSPQLSAGQGGRRASSYAGARGRGQTLIDQIPGRRAAMNAGQGLTPQQQQERERDCVIM